MKGLKGRMEDSKNRWKTMRIAGTERNNKVGKQIILVKIS